MSACLGGPSLTIHSENTGVLAVTRIYSPFVVRCGAVWMALFAFVPKFEALCRSIPNPVIGGVGILLYGMVTSVGVRTVVENRVDFSKPKNLIVASAILILAVGGATFTFPGGISLGGMGHRGHRGHHPQPRAPQQERGGACRGSQGEGSRESGITQPTPFLK